MNLIELQYAKYSLHFNSSFQSSKNAFTKKKIILLKLKTGNGKECFGEVSLLPEIGTETFEEALENIRQIKKSIVNGTISSTGDIEKYLQKLPNRPALTFGFEQALFYLNENKFERKLIEINAIIGISSIEKMLRQISENYKAGYRIFKLKIGEKSFEEDLQLLDYLKQKYDRSIKFRLDVNGAWDYEKTKKNIEKLGVYNIEFIEQPVLNETELEKLAVESKIKIVADESVNNFETAKKIILNSGIKILVLKPVLIGSVKKTLELIELAKGHNKSIIISSTFESAVGLNMLIHLACSTESKFAHGLGTFKYLKNNFEDRSITFNPPGLNLNEPGKNAFVFSNLNWK
ncbi:MAG: o-succinylbenzoate synthase [Ignavibacteria bacterium]|jgi:o-succinylbenzoate synthase